MGSFFAIIHYIIYSTIFDTCEVIVSKCCEFLSVLEHLEDILKL